MTRRQAFFIPPAVLATLSTAVAADKRYGYDDTPFLPGQKWRVHDSNRPLPRVVHPGNGAESTAPSDAIVLFDGKDLSTWVAWDEGRLTPPRWKMEYGYFEVVVGTGSLVTREKFGDVQLHIEWATPAQVTHDDQSRGNSGVLLMGRYEIQVLDCHNNPTYADGHAGAIYGQYPPLVNASRGPGEWQSFDIVFEAPKFEGNRLLTPAFFTVIHNGVLVQNRQPAIGRMAFREVGTYAPHGDQEPLALQDHGVPVRFRNIWIRRLALNGDTK